eukprot:scaffold4656_cov117-Isochrysis_galbana.AAC.14
MVSQRATPAAPTWPEHQHNTTACPPVRPEAHKPEPARALHITPSLLTGRCFKSADCWALLCEELQGRSTTIQQAARHQHNITAIAPPRAQAGSCQSLAHQATRAFLRLLYSECWAPLCVELKGRSTIVQSAVNY